MTSIHCVLRGNDVFFRCDDCGAERPVAVDESFLRELRFVAHTHVCVPNSTGIRPHLTIVRESDDATR